MSRKKQKKKVKLKLHHESLSTNLIMGCLLGLHMAVVSSCLGGYCKNTEAAGGRIFYKDEQKNSSMAREEQTTHSLAAADLQYRWVLTTRGNGKEPIQNQGV